MYLKSLLFEALCTMNWMVAFTVAVFPCNVTSVNQFILTPADNNSQVQYINVTYGIEYYNIGFNPSTGQNQYMIIYENFDNTALNPISKV